MKKSEAPAPRAEYPMVELTPVLDTMLGEGRLLHSILLEGEAGIGRKTMAYSLAAAVLCEGEKQPCGECTPCRKVLTGVHPDVIFVDGLADPDAYKVKNLRELLGRAWLQPSEGRVKVMILAEVQRMDADAQNILLKIIEEPPRDTYFFLTCNNRYRLLSTVLSRVVTVPVRGITREECVNRLALLVPGHSNEEYAAACHLCGNSPGQAAQLLTDAAVADRWEAAKNAVTALAREDAFGAIAAITPFEKKRLEYELFLETAAAVAANRDLWDELGLAPTVAAALGLHLQDIIRRAAANAYLPLCSAMFGSWHKGK